MILTCPECASRYFVDDSKVGASGRVVRCAACGNRWTARNEEEPLDLFEDPSASAVVGESLAGSPDGAEAGMGAEPPVSALPGEELPKVFRARADAERRLREAKTTGIVWASMAVVLVLILTCAIVFRMNVASLWPKTAGAYALVKRPVNTVGLQIEDLKAEPSMENGHAAVTITGVLRNITDHPVATPPVRVSLLNEHDKRVAGQLAAAADPTIPPSQTRHFAVTLLDPPRTAKTLEIGFALEPGAAQAARHALKSPTGEAHDSPSLRGVQDQPIDPAAAAADTQGAGQEAPGHETGAVETASADHH